MYKLQPTTKQRLDALGLHVSSCHQPEALFIDNGRRLKRVAEPCDPWVAQLFHGTHSWHANFVSWGKGASADEAVADALANSDHLTARMRLLASEVEKLTGAMRGFA